MWRWDGPPVGGPDGADRRRWKSDQRRATDLADPPHRERVALRRIRDLASALADVSDAYEAMNGDTLGGHHIAAAASIDAMRGIATKLQDATNALGELYE